MPCREAQDLTPPKLNGKNVDYSCSLSNSGNDASLDDAILQVKSAVSFGSASVENKLAEIKGQVPLTCGSSDWRVFVENFLCLHATANIN